jgi:hypothetical protein
VRGIITAIPEAPLATEIVRNWCRDILDTRGLPRDKMMLSFLYEAASLCYLVDDNAEKYLSRAPLLGIFEGLRSYHRQSADNTTVYVVPELYKCLEAADTSFISAGVLFLK